MAKPIGSDEGSKGRRCRAVKPASCAVMLLCGVALLASVGGFAPKASAQGLEVIVPSIGSGSPAYRFNEELSVFERAPDALGPLVAEGARTVGKHQLFVSLLYTHLDFKRADGESIDSPVVAAEIGATVEKFTLGIIDLIAEFGLTDHIEVSIDLPIVLVDLDTDAADISENGIGDIRLKTKWNFFQQKGLLPDMAVQGQVQVPSGDADKLLGTDQTHFTFAFVASDTVFNGWVSPHFNWDIELTTEQDSDDGARELWNTKWVLGADGHVHDRVNVSLDFLGRHKLDGETDFGENLVDVAFGAKVNPYGRFNLFAAVLVPLNKDEGLRTDVTWRIGGEATFF